MGMTERFQESRHTVKLKTRVLITLADEIIDI